MTTKKGEKVTAVVETNCGTFDIELATTEAPTIANSFAYLAEEGFYDELTFHRIVPEFVIQGGDPKGTGGGGPGYQVVEAPPKNLKYTLGTVAMAKTETELRPAPPAASSTSSAARRAKRCRPNTRWPATSPKASTWSKRSANWAGRKKNRPSPS